MQQVQTSCWVLSSWGSHKGMESVRELITGRGCTGGYSNPLHSIPLWQQQKSIVGRLRR